jgi:hypothetical protein
MNHLPFIAASYGIFVAVAVYLSADAAWRLGKTTRKLAALDHRKKPV